MGRGADQILFGEASDLRAAHSARRTAHWKSDPGRAELAEILSSPEQEAALTRLALRHFPTDLGTDWAKILTLDKPGISVQVMFSSVNERGQLAGVRRYFGDSVSLDRWRLSPDAQAFETDRRDWLVQAGYPSRLVEERLGAVLDELAPRPLQSTSLAG